MKSLYAYDNLHVKTDELFAIDQTIAEDIVTLEQLAGELGDKAFRQEIVSRLPGESEDDALTIQDSVDSLMELSSSHTMRFIDAAYHMNFGHLL